MVLVDWMLTNKVTVDTLAAIADPAKEARNQNLPQSPFIALVRKAKELRASEAMKKVRSHSPGFSRPKKPSLTPETC